MRSFFLWGHAQIMLVGLNKEIGHQLHSGIDGVLAEVGDACGGQNFVVDEEIACASAAVAAKNVEGRVAHNRRITRALYHFIAAEQVLDGSGSDGCAGPKGIDGDAVFFELFGETEHAEAHTKLGDGIGDVAREPARFHIEGGREGKDVRIFGFFEVGKAVFCAHVSAARVDTVHEVVALHVGILGIGELDGAGVVDENVDAAEFLDSLSDGLGDAGFVADIDDEGEGLAASGDDFFGCGENRAFEAGMRFGCFGGDDYVSAFLSEAEGDGFADTATCACDKCRFTFKLHENNFEELTNFGVICSTFAENRKQS